MRQYLPELALEFRPPVSCPEDFPFLLGTDQLRELWSITSGQASGTLGVLGGLQLLGPAESLSEYKKWESLIRPVHQADLRSVRTPDASTSRDRSAVKAVYFSPGWIPILREPLEANYLAIDCDPLPGGHPGQIILCGRDEDEKCVVAPDLKDMLERLELDCRRGVWEMRTGKNKSGPFNYMTRRDGRLLTAIKDPEWWS